MAIYCISTRGSSQESKVSPPHDKTLRQAHILPDDPSLTIINMETSQEVDSKEQLKEAFRLLCEVLFSFFTFLNQTVRRRLNRICFKARHLPIFGKCDRVFWKVFALLIAKLCPDSRSQRRHLLVYSVGFLLGSFVYVSMLNISYALHYDGRKIKILTTRPWFISTTPPWSSGGSNNQRSGYTTDEQGRWGLTTMGPSGINQQRAFDQGRLNFKDLAKAKGWLDGSPATMKQVDQPVIPRTIHQSWHIKLVPKEFSHWMLSWRKNHPTWRHLFWTGKGGSRLIYKEFPEFRSLYENYTTELHRFKVNRFFILYHYGGVFADLDLESIKPLGPLLERYSCVLTEQPLVHRAVLFNLTAPNYILNSFLACSPRHPFIKFVLDMLETYHAYDSDIEPDIERVEKSVGSLFLGDVLELYKIAFNRTVAEHVHVLPSDWLMPNWNEQYRSALATRCLSRVVLNRRAKELCEQLMRTDFSNPVPRQALNLCHWVDMYDEDTRIKVAQGPIIAVDKL